MEYNTVSDFKFVKKNNKKKPDLRKAAHTTLQI
jgi:hypothetical protein